jgi:acetyl esterase
MRWIILSVLFLFSCPASAQKTDAPAGERRVYKHSAGKPRELELYFPPNHDPAKAKVPGLILFHGGGWSGGNLGQFRAACAYFASRGLVCATAEYRMLTKEEAKALPAGTTKKRVCVTDAKSAIRWFKQHASELGIDPAKIITGGGSAGGHLSAIATLNPGLNDPADPTDMDTRVVAYLWFNPAFAPDDAADPEIDVLRFVKKDLPPAIAFFGTEDSWKKGWDAALAKWHEAGLRLDRPASRRRRRARLFQPGSLAKRHPHRRGPVSRRTRVARGRADEGRSGGCGIVGGRQAVNLEIIREHPTPSSPRPDWVHSAGSSSMMISHSFFQ